MRYYSKVEIHKVLSQVRQGRTLQSVIRDAFGASATDSTGVNLVRRCRTLLFLDKFLKPTCLGYGIIMYTHP